MTHFWLWTLLLSPILGILVGRAFSFWQKAEQIQGFIDSLEEVEKQVEEARARIR